MIRRRRTISDRNWDLLDRYLAGAASPVERVRFEEWLAAKPRRAAQLRDLKRALAAMVAGGNENEREAAWERAAKHIE